MSFSINRHGIAALALVAAISGCKREEVRSFQGMTEAETVRLSAPQAGNLSVLKVKRGSRVTEGTPVFSVAEAGDVSAHRQAEQRLALAEGRRKGAAADPREVENLKVEVAETQWKLSQKSASAPVDGLVVATLFAEGEWVPAGAPVVEILAVDKIKVRFEVPQAVAVHLQHGRSVKLICAQCRESVEATVVYISPFAQPGQGVAGSLSYMVEARPNAAQAALLKAGLPVTVIL